MTEPKTMTNEERLDFLVRTGKLSLEQMALQDDFCNPVIVHENLDDHEVRVILLAGGLGEDRKLLIEGLVAAAEKPQAMISLTSDMFMSEAPASYGVGNLGRAGNARPADAFAQGDPHTTEALQVVVVFIGEDDVHEVDVPYKREGTTIIWGEERRHVVNSAIAGAIRAAMTASHARMSS